MNSEINDVKRLAYKVLFPAYDDVDFLKKIDGFISKGGCSFIIGETRAEYVARAMSEQREKEELSHEIQSMLSSLKSKFGNLIVAIDYENKGINRLQHFGDFTNHSDVNGKTSLAGKIANELGINTFLGPIADVVDGVNPWLKGRHEVGSASEVSKAVAQFVNVSKECGIKTVTKHFPGFKHLPVDPAEKDIELETSLADIKINLSPFITAISHGTAGIMIGPAVVKAIDSHNAACVSAAVVDMLRTDLNYSGLIVSDDLDAPATMKNNTIEETVLKALNAGVELLLLSGSNDLDKIAEYIISSVDNGTLPVEKLLSASRSIDKFLS